LGILKEQSSECDPAYPLIGMPVHVHVAFDLVLQILFFMGFLGLHKMDVTLSAG